MGVTDDQNRVKCDQLTVLARECVCRGLLEFGVGERVEEVDRLFGGVLAEGFDDFAELAAVAQPPQLSAALSKAAIVAVAVLSERELASAHSGAPPTHPQPPPRSGTDPAAHTPRNADAARGTPAARAE